jgi:hypothetical protein
MTSIAPARLVPWLRDVFPSLIWPSAVLHERGLDDGMIVAARVLDILAKYVPDSVVLDGSLQSLESVPEDNRAEALQALRGAGSLYEEAFPWLLVRALNRYDGLPGAWVFDGWTGARPVVTLRPPHHHQHPLPRHRPHPAIRHQEPALTPHQLRRHVRSPGARASLASHRRSGIARTG